MPCMHRISHITPSRTPILPIAKRLYPSCLRPAPTLFSNPRRYSKRDRVNPVAAWCRTLARPRAAERGSCGPRGLSRPRGTCQPGARAGRHSLRLACSEAPGVVQFGAHDVAACGLSVGPAPPAIPSSRVPPVRSRASTSAGRAASRAHRKLRAQSQCGRRRWRRRQRRCRGTRRSTFPRCLVAPAVRPGPKS